MAAKLVLEYTIGKPDKPVTPDRLDQEEFQHFRETRGLFTDSVNLMHNVEPEMVLTLLRAGRMGAPSGRVIRASIGGRTSSGWSSSWTRTGSR